MPNAMVNTEMTVLSAAVLGCVDAFGGFGTASGLILALAILQVISSGFNRFGLSNDLTAAIWGATLILVITVQTMRRHLAALFGTWRAVRQR